MSEGLWSMGAVVRRCGIGEHTLRAWERRFGFPRPKRLPSGHRRFSEHDVERLLMIGAALALGHRAGDVVPLDMEQLSALAGGSVRLLQQPPAAATEPPWIQEMIGVCRRFDHAMAVQMIRRWAASTGTLAFLKFRIVPLLEEIGVRWRAGELDIRHEHFMSEILNDELRGLRRPLETRDYHPEILLAGLPGEQHGLGLQMVALLAASVGVNVHQLGPQVPVVDIVEAARTIGITAVGISVSGAADTRKAADHVAELRRQLPDRVRLWIGGRGASEMDPVPDGIVTFDTLDGAAAAISALAG